jgi:hypothetical protein
MVKDNNRSINLNGNVPDWRHIKNGRLISGIEFYADQLYIVKTDDGVEIVLSDGRTQNSWTCDRGILEEGKTHHIGIVVDAGPRIITFVIDGKVCDGGEYRQFGWGRFSQHLRHANGSGTAQINSEGRVTVKEINIYDRALMNSELIGNYKSKKLGGIVNV